MGSRQRVIQPRDTRIRPTRDTMRSPEQIHFVINELGWISPAFGGLNQNCLNVETAKHIAGSGAGAWLRQEGAASTPHRRQRTEGDLKDALIVAAHVQNCVNQRTQAAPSAAAAPRSAGCRQSKSLLRTAGTGRMAARDGASGNRHAQEAMPRVQLSSSPHRAACGSALDCPGRHGQALPVASCAPRARVLGLRPVLPGRRPEVRQRRRAHPAPDRAVRRRLGDLGPRPAAAAAGRGTRGARRDIGRPGASPVGCAGERRSARQRRVDIDAVVAADAAPPGGAVAHVGRQAARARTRPRYTGSDSADLPGFAGARRVPPTRSRPRWPCRP